MIPFHAIDGAMSAFLAGLVTSLHCAGMCGPLACYLASPTSKASFSTIATLYQCGRLLSYTIVGAIAGGAGMLALGWVQLFQYSISRFLPWILVGFFLMMALRLDQWLPKPALASGLIRRLNARIQRLPRPLSAGAMGLLTPLLPCAPLYAVFGLALLTQSPLRGAEFLLAFGLGTLPLLWFTQAAFNRWQSRFSPIAVSRAQRVLALIVALILGMRLYLFETGENGLFCGSIP
ncbi:MAG: hypothetical protein RL648_276 [Verrucomicrobiota bacterium]|jgi:sulfite exporter TauE/SafE